MMCQHQKIQTETTSFNIKSTAQQINQTFFSVFLRCAMFLRYGSLHLHHYYYYLYEDMLILMRQNGCIRETAA